MGRSATFLKILVIVIIAAPLSGINLTSISSRVFIIIWHIKLTATFAATIQIIKYSDFGFFLYKNNAYNIPDKPIFKSKSGLNEPPANNKNPIMFARNPAANATAGPNKNAIVARKRNPNLISKAGLNGISNILSPIIVSAINTAVKVIVRTFLKFAAISEIPSTSKTFLIKITSKNKYFFDMKLIIQKKYDVVNENIIIFLRFFASLRMTGEEGGRNDRREESKE